MAAGARLGRRAPGGGSAWCERDDGSDAKLPCTHRQHEKREDAGGEPERQHMESKRGAGDHDHHGQRQPRPIPRQQHEHEREEQIELLLDAQRPGVQQGLLVRVHGKVIRVAPRINIRNEGEGGEQRLSVPDEVRGQEDQNRNDGTAGEHRQQGRHDAPYSPLVESAQRETPGQHLAVDDLRDQVARQHEEDVDAEVAAGDSLRREMEQDDRQHGNRTQPVDVGAIRGRQATHQVVAGALRLCNLFERGHEILDQLEHIDEPVVHGHGRDADDVGFAPVADHAVIGERVENAPAAPGATVDAQR